MKKFLQEAGPSHVWIQTWQTEGMRDFQANEPIVFPEMDDWQAQLFNYYFLSSFSSETVGTLNSELPGFANQSDILESYFANGGLGESHSQFSSKWAELIPSCDEDSCWFSVAWDHFVLDEYEGRALGFFFTSERKSFLNLNDTESLTMRGIPLQKPDYAALFLEGEEGKFRLFVVEPGGQTALRTAWTQGLFPFQPMYQDAFHAKQFFKLCKSFSEDVLVKEKQNSREDQVAFLSDSLDYASKKSEISMENFKADVLKEPAIVDAFETYQEKYSGTKGWNPPDRFAMTEESHSQAKKSVKSIIKLDKNFHIYVHGNKERIEKGFDENRRLNFYTLWFDAEA